MPKPRVLATRPLFPAAQQVLNASCDVQYWTKAERISKQELFELIKDKEGLVCLLTEKVDDELLRAAPKLRIAANVAVGFDNIDVAACTRRGVVATNTPGVLDETTADFAWTLMMAVARRIGEGEQLARSGNWLGWDLDQLVGTDVWGKTLGLVGFGRIGRAVARRAAGFQMKVHLHRCHSRAVGHREGIEGGASGLQHIVSGGGLCEFARPVVAGDSRIDGWREVSAHEADRIPDQYRAGTGGG